MKQVVLSLQDDSEKRLRRLAHELKGGKKGALSKTVEESLILLEKEMKRRAAFKRLMEIANENRVLGIGKFSRDDIYE